MNTRILIVISSIAGAAAGAAGGYLFAKKQLEEKYVELAVKEIDQSREFFKALYKGDGFGSPEEVLQNSLAKDNDLIPTHASIKKELGEFEQIIEDLDYNNKLSKSNQVRTVDGSTKKLPRQKVNHNIFAGSEEDGDWTHEEEMRSKNEPYIISFEEFQEGLPGQSQVTLTYYSTDDVLIEPNDVPVDNVEYLVGTANLDRFGHRSKDPNVVYIRNERVGVDYEICLSKGSFAAELGLEEPEEPIRPRKRAPRTPRE